MEKQTFHVKVGEKIREYEAGTSYLKIAEDFQQDYENDIVLAFVNGKLQELNHKLRTDAVVEFVTTASKIGHATYRRSMCFLMVKAIYDIYEKEEIQKVWIHFSVDNGFYCTVEGDAIKDEKFLEKVGVQMEILNRKKIPIRKRSVPTDEAISLFKQYEMLDKEMLFEYRRSSAVNLYNIDGFEDYFYGYMVPHTGYLKYFKLIPYNEGFVLAMPGRKAPEEVKEFHPVDKLFRVLKESEDWGKLQGISTVGELNDKITHTDFREFILVQEASQEKKIAQIAETIATKENIRFILIAGPSSSGKTTFSHRLSIQLKACGLSPRPIAVDNFFVEREETPKDENGEYDFECLETVDLDLFNECMNGLLNGEEVRLPVFNFKTGHKEFSNQPIKMAENEVFVIEGIHCLNPKLSEKLPEENKFRIYISALTQLNVDVHNRIPTTDGRLIRRIVRDARTRGTSAKSTIARWDSVRRGEERNIFPYQDQADVMFNSSLIYEFSVLKQYVEPLLFGLDKDCEEYVEAKRLLKFLDYFVGIGSETVPVNSLLREFIGNGCFDI